MARKLKVFRTPAGFHDAYVAAPSRKAALAAWGADADLFARGVAEEVTDAALMEEPLARPGEVVRRSRGSAAEQLAALPPDRPKRARAAEEEAPRSRTARSKAATKPPAPRPSRAELEAAEAALEQEDARRRDEDKALAERQAALDRERREAGRRHERERARLEAARQRAADAYAAAVKKWRR
ncbi:hypothetical protein [Sphingomonas sp. BK345]|uniref:hypothetical protein n=1 Tax=Sphingomonas sp. BK345 TaxID=2586980 RepID=UPI001621E976|nr:hypothetical protein [Sphingomonas sp. BK345]MBB3475658.1 type IV secretory pathway VirB10-like protein [Sphingomonas sp. BK345]